MYRFIHPDSPHELTLRMLFQPAGPSLFHRAAEADSHRGRVAALLHAASPTDLPLRLLFHPPGPSLFHRACEADSHRGLFAALLDDPDYETASLEKRLEERLRMAGDLVLLASVDGRRLEVSDRDR